MNILHLYVFFFSPFFFFLVRVCAWFGVDDSLGLLGLGEAITPLNKNDEPPSEPLCLHAYHLQLLHWEVIRIHKFTK